MDPSQPIITSLIMSSNYAQPERNAFSRHSSPATAGRAGGGECNEALYGPRKRDRFTVVFESPRGGISRGTLDRYKHTRGEVNTPYPSDYQVTFSALQNVWS